jgi:fatty acid desaturase
MQLPPDFVMLRGMSQLPELGELRSELRAAGVFEHAELRSWGKLVVLGAALAVCLAAIARFGVLAALVVVPAAGVISTAIAMMGHEGSHRSFSKSAWRNQVLVYLTFPLFSGLGLLYWRNKHDRLHHGHPNVEGVDPDIKPFPFVSSRGDHERCGRKMRWFQRNLQRTAFWPMSTLMALGMRRSSLIYAFKFPKQHGFTRAWAVEIVCLALHYVCWIIIPSLIWGPLVGLALYAGIWGFVGVFLALVFAPAHMGLPVVDGQHHDWVHQLETTRDLALPRPIAFFFIGLDNQVPHHLFPKIPHQHLARAASITQAWCERHGLPYFRMPYLDALKDSAQFIGEAWKREARLPIDIRAAHLVM